MASVNLQQDDIGSINSIIEAADNDTDALEESLIRPGDDDRDVIACLPPRDRYISLCVHVCSGTIATVLLTVLEARVWNFKFKKCRY